VRTPTFCDFCDHDTVPVHLDGTFTCEYCGAEHLLSDWEDYETNHTIRISDLREVPEATQVQVRGAAPPPEKIGGDEARDGRPPGD